jgi:mono/diheme cytochrome c family protein
MSAQILTRLLRLAAAVPVFGLAAAAAEPAQPDAARQQELRRILARECAVCHGASLQGDLGPALTAKTLAGRSEDALVLTILEGHDETAMPPWWWTLNESDTRWLLRFIRNSEGE